MLERGVSFNKWEPTAWTRKLARFRLAREAEEVEAEGDATLVNDEEDEGM